MQLRVRQSFPNYGHLVHALIRRQGQADQFNAGVRCAPPASYYGYQTLKTDVNGNWDGTVTIASTWWWPDGLQGNLHIRVSGPSAPFDSNPIQGVMVKNHALVLGSGDDEHPEHQQMINELVSGVGSSLAGMGHSRVQTIYMAKNEILSNIPLSTVFYYAGHAAIPAQPYSFKACVGGEWIEQTEVNDTVYLMSPRYNLAYMDTCFSGDDATDENMFWNADEPSVDTCYFGWEGISYFWQSYKNYTLTFFQLLAQGWIARDAKEWAEIINGPTNGRLFRDRENFRLHWPYGQPGPGPP